MANINDAIDRIKVLECPTGEIENRAIQILEEYGIANKNQISSNREERLDTNDAQAYRIEIQNIKDNSIIILAESGLDDYVAKVVDVYTI